ncbi:tripartite motif-containing protein 47 [Oreochromis niloticus]|uniref:Tripartite motif-containing protein 47 n=2 Tax=Oreochromis TaxID=8139 RepID=I3JM64_ORENI|nr:tripartite motif-containing protein 47 [Oreochromis niloticus]XP_039465867.1 E3 ubiquitin-protein ligase TRIM47-like isoform X2 [Oreochromis aureus]
MASKQQHQQDEPHGVDLDCIQFSCSVCLDLLKEPVTIHCGHSYCKSCIEDCWDREEEKGEYSCPQCRETFSHRPVLRRNNMLAEVVNKLKSTKPTCPSLVYASPTDVACDFCCGIRIKATMSCLTCLASYCPTHLEPHYSVAVLKKHELVAATVSIQEKMCTKHSKLKELYCEQDEQLVCSLCTVDEHKGHGCVSASALKDKAKNQLALNQSKIQDKVQKKEKELKELSQAEESLKSSALISLNDCDKIFDELISSMQRKQSEVKQLIKVQEKTATAQVEDRQSQLKEEITKLKRTYAELEKASDADDLIYLMQHLSTSWDSPDGSPGAPPQRSFKDITKCLSELKDKLEMSLKETWPRISATVSYVDFSLPPAPSSREELLRYVYPLTLDGTSNYRYLHLICENRRMRPSPGQASAHLGRFTKFPQVLCREGLADRCYWEVEGHARTLSVAVAYKNISRTSDESQFGKNDKSWSLDCTADGFLFCHNNVETKVPGSGLCKIGVFLDYKAGTLCFYRVSDPMVLIHQVQTAFIQPLYPGVGINYEWYDTGVFAQLVKLW